MTNIKTKIINNQTQQLPHYVFKLILLHHELPLAKSSIWHQHAQQNIGTISKTYCTASLEANAVMKRSPLHHSICLQTCCAICFANCANVLLCTLMSYWTFCHSVQALPCTECGHQCVVRGQPQKTSPRSTNWDSLSHSRPIWRLHAAPPGQLQSGFVLAHSWL